MIVVINFLTAYKVILFSAVWVVSSLYQKPYLKFFDIFLLFHMDLAKFLHV